MARDNRAPNFVFVSESEAVKIHDIVDMGDATAIAQRVEALRLVYHEWRESRRAGLSVQVPILTADGSMSALEPTLAEAENLTWRLQRIADDGEEWGALISAGLTDLYLDIITDPGFFTEHVTLIDAILLGFVSVVKHGFYDDTLSTSLLSNAHRLWKTVWDSRISIRACPRNERGEGFRGTGKFTEPVANALICYHGLYLHRHSRSPPFDSYMPHAGLLLWERTKGRQELADGAACCLKTLDLFNSKRTPELMQAADGFVKDVIVDGIGLEAFRVRLEQDARRLSCPRDEDVRDTEYFSWSLLYTPMASTHVLPYLMRFDTLGICVELCNMLSRERCLHEGTYMMIFQLAYQIFRRALIYWSENIEQDIVFRGDTVVDMLSRAMEVTARVGSGTATARIEASFLQLMCEDIQYLISLFKNLDGRASGRLRMAQFIADCRAHAPFQWYPALSLLDAAIYRGELKDNMHGYLVLLWTRFGNALGLTKDKERARLTRQSRIHCAWPACVYHTDDPGRTLSSCKGCGQARYCTRSCQTSHWKAGHKKDFGNRLKG